MESIDESLKSFLDNPIVLGIVAIFITMYGPRLSPKLPDFVKDAFNNSVFRFIIMVLVIFSGLKDIRLALIISILFIGIMSIVNTQNIKEDYHNQVQEYYANYNLFDKKSTEHFENVKENYDNMSGTSPNLLNKESKKKVVVHEEEDVEEDAQEQNDDMNVEEDNTVDESENVPKKKNAVLELPDENTNSRIVKYIDTSIEVLDDMRNFAKVPASGVSKQCQNAITMPDLKCINEIKSKISKETLSEMTKNNISRRFQETKWLD